MAQRSLRILGQGSNTAWTAPTTASGVTTSWYGVIHGPFLQDAGFTVGGNGTTGSPTPTGNQYGGYNESGFACVLSRMYHTLYQYAANYSTLTSQVNVQGVVSSAAAAGTGAGNMAAVTTPQALSNPTVWYDATDIDAITAGQTVGFMQTLNTGGGGPVNPALGCVCDSLSQGFSSPFVFPMTTGSAPSSLLNGLQYCHLQGQSGGGGAAGASSTQSLAQDFAPNAFVGSWLQWQNTAAGSSDTTATGSGKIAALAYSSTWNGALTVSSLAARVTSTGAVGLFHDVTDIFAVPAGSYPTIEWNGSTSSVGNEKIGNLGVHVSSARNDTTYLVSGTMSATGISWSCTTSGIGIVAGTTYTTFGHPRGDNTFFENHNAIAAAGIFWNLAFLTGTQTYGGTPSSVNLQRSIGSSPSVSGSIGSGVLTTNANAGFVNTGIAVNLNAASQWFYDNTDIAAFLPMDGFELAVTSARNGSDITYSISGAPSYNSTTGAVTVTTTTTHAIQVGDTIKVSGITGTGSYSSLNTTTTAAAGTTGTTVVYNVASGLTLTTNSGGSVDDYLSVAWQGYSCLFTAANHGALTTMGAG